MSNRVMLAMLPTRANNSITARGTPKSIRLLYITPPCGLTMGHTKVRKALLHLSFQQEAYPESGVRDRHYGPNRCANFRRNLREISVGNSRLYLPIYNNAQC